MSAASKEATTQRTPAAPAVSQPAKDLLHQFEPTTSHPDIMSPSTPVPLSGNHWARAPDTLNANEMQSALVQFESFIKETAEKSTIKFTPASAMQQIIDDFNAFQDAPENASNRDNFRCEHKKGPPITCVFTLPDKESMAKFITQLVERGKINSPIPEKSAAGNPNKATSSGLSTLADTEANADSLTQMSQLK